FLVFIMAHPLFGPELRRMLQDNDVEEMKTLAETLHPATVAETLAEDFTIDGQVKMVEGTGRQHMAKLIEQMSHDDRADLLRRLPPRVAEALLRLVDEAERRDIATLVKYPE